MKEITIEGHTLSLEFWQVPTGFRLHVNEYNGREWNTVSAYLYVLMTEFEALASFSSEFLGDSVHAETMAQQLGIDMRFWEDADCAKCGAWYHYMDMTELPSGFYVCTDCEGDLMIIKDCPNHGGNYDCSPFCALCEGTQEIQEGGN